MSVLASLALAAVPQAPVEAPPPDGAELRAAGTADRILEGSPDVRFDHLGFSLASGGDWDGAGASDLLVGGSNLYDSNLAPPSNKLDAAGLFLLPGPGDLDTLPRLSSRNYLRFEGAQNGDRFGYEVAFLGDVDGNGDGRSEIAIGAPRGPQVEGARGFSERGAVYLFTAGHFADFGPGDALSANDACVAIFGEEPGDRFGWSIEALDFDGDGVPDLAIGAPGCLTDPLFPGRVYVIPGARLRIALAQHRPGRKLAVTAPSLGALVITGLGGSDRFGYALSSPGDVDGDGNDDLAVGAPSFQFSAHDSVWIQPHPQLKPPRESIGYVALYRGRALDGELVDRPADAILRGEQPGAQFGASLAARHDMEDDAGELIVGAPFHAAEQPGEAPALAEAGRAVVYSLRGGARVLATLDGDAAGHRMGYSVAVLGDVDGDGRGDFALGGMLGGRPVTDVDGAGEQGGPRCGRVWIVRGPGADAGPATCLVEVFGEGAFDRLGTSLAPLGDLDGNGRTDVAIGAPSFPFRPGDDFGRIYLLLF